MYPSTKALKRPEVKAFMDYIVENQQDIADASQIVAMNQEQADKAKAAAWAASGSGQHSCGWKRPPGGTEPPGGPPPLGGDGHQGHPRDWPR